MAKKKDQKPICDHNEYGYFSGVKLMQRRFTLDYWLDGVWYVGVLREVPGVCSQGKTLEELKANIVDAYLDFVGTDYPAKILNEG